MRWVGVCAAAAACEWSPPPAPAAALPTWAEDLYAESASSIDELLVQFDPARVGEVFPVYRDLARALTPATRLLVVVSDRSALPAAQLTFAAAGFVPARTEFVVVDQEFTIWARDRMIPIGNGLDRSSFVPPESEIIADRAADVRAIEGVTALRSIRMVRDLFLEGGNALTTSRHILVGGNVESHNGLLDVRNVLRDVFHREPILLSGTGGEVPVGHLDMYLTVLGENLLLLGDPALGAEFLRRMRYVGAADGLFGEWFAETSEHEQMRLVPVYEAIRTQLVRAGYRVARVPILHGSEDRVMTWNNALVEHRDGRARAYVPVYGLPLLDEDALAAYRRLGVEAYPIDVSRVAPFGGTVRCLTNVVEFSRRKAIPPATR